MPTSMGVHIRFPEELLNRVNDYRKKNNLKNNSVAVRELMEFALETLDSEQSNGAVSDRKILEEILAIAKENSAIMCQIHTFSYSSNMESHIVKNSKELRLRAKAFGRKKSSEFIVRESEKKEV